MLTTLPTIFLALERPRAISTILKVFHFNFSAIDLTNLIDFILMKFIIKKWLKWIKLIFFLYFKRKNKQHKFLNKSKITLYLSSVIYASCFSFVSLYTFTKTFLKVKFIDLKNYWLFLNFQLFYIFSIFNCFFRTFKFVNNFQI